MVFVSKMYGTVLYEVIPGYIPFSKVLHRVVQSFSQLAHMQRCKVLVTKVALLK